MAMKKLQGLVVALGLAISTTSAHADIWDDLWNKQCHYEYETTHSGEWTIVYRRQVCTILGGIPVWGGPPVEYARHKTGVVQPTAVAVATPM
jgi:hypothetical protein